MEKEKNKQHDLRDDIRIRDEMKAMAIAEGMGPSAGAPPTQDVDSQLKIAKENSGPMNPNLMASQGAKAGGSFGTVNGARRTAYAANQHSVSIIGSDIGRQYLPENVAPAQVNQFGEPTEGYVGVQVETGNGQRTSQSPNRIQGDQNQMQAMSPTNVHSPFK